MNLKGKKIYYNIFGAFIIKGGSVIVGVLTIPAYMRYFPNATILGVWYTMLSLLTWILNFDLGIGNGMRNYLVPSFIDRDWPEMKKIISSAYYSIGIVSVVFAIVGFIVTRVFNWNEFFNVAPEIISEQTLKTSMQIVLFGIIGQFFFKLIAAILNAMERNALTSALPLMSNLLILVFVSLPTALSEEKKMMILSYVYVFAVNVPYIIVTILLFYGELKKAKPTISGYQRSIAKSILTLGSGFFSVQLALILITVTNEIIIAKFYGAKYVVDFQVYNKIFYTVVTLFSLITNPIWSAVTTAYYEGRIAWINKAYKKVIRIAILVSIILISLIFVFQFIVDIWLKDGRIVVERRALISFAFYSIVLTFCYAESAFANGMSKLRTQFLCYFAAVILKLPITYLMSRTINEWHVVVLANAICLLPYAIIQPFILKNDIKRFVPNK